MTAPQPTTATRTAPCGPADDVEFSAGTAPPLASASLQRGQHLACVGCSHEVGIDRQRLLERRPRLGRVAMRCVGQAEVVVISRVLGDAA